MIICLNKTKPDESIMDIAIDRANDCRILAMEEAIVQFHISNVWYYIVWNVDGPLPLAEPLLKRDKEKWEHYIKAYKGGAEN